MNVIKDFFAIYSMYRQAKHPRGYCARIAWDMVVNRTPF